MNAARTSGLEALLIGALLPGFAYSATEASVERISNRLAGRRTGTAPNCIVAGVAAVLFGGFIASLGRRRRVS